MSAVKFSKALYDFEAFLDVQKNLAPGTRKAYVYDLDRFMDDWIERRGENPTVDKVAADDIRRYLERLRAERNYKSTTLSRVIASIRIFFEYCVEQGILEASPAAHIHNPKIPKRLPVFLVEGEMRRLIQTPPVDAPEAGEGPVLKEGGPSPLEKPRRKDYESLPTRDKAILVCLGFTGMRLSELVGLDVPDLNFSHNTVRVFGKGAKERMLPLNKAVQQALQEWLDVRSPAETSEEAVFLNRFGRRISPRGVQKMVDKHVQAAGITKRKVSPHKLRHTFATLLHLSGVDILEIQALMGHATITSTQIYTHVSSKRLQSAVEKLDLGED